MADNHAISYNDSTIKESLWDQIKDLDAINTYVTSKAGEVVVKQKTHHWETQDLATISAQNTVAEMADTSYDTVDPTDHYNSTEIIEKGFKVSTTDEVSDHAGFKSRYAREQVQAMKLYKNQLEFDVLRGTLCTGSSTITARAMAGIHTFAGNTYTTASGSVTFDSTEFNRLMGLAWDDGAQIETVLVSNLKDKVSGFTAGNTRNVDAKAAELVGRVDVYDGDNGRHTIVKHRYIVAGELIGYVNDFVLVGHLDAPKVAERPRAGRYLAGAVGGEATCQVSNPKAVIYAKTYAV